MRFSRFGWPDAAHIGQFETSAAFAASVCLLYTALVVLLSNTRTFSSLFSVSPPRMYSMTPRLSVTCGSAISSSRRPSTARFEYACLWYVPYSRPHSWPRISEPV